MKERDLEGDSVVTHYLEYINTDAAETKTGTADGLLLDSEIAKQLVAQFIHNMLVKTSPWPQVCCENKITHQVGA